MENNITKEMIDRINELAHKAKSAEGLTEEEQAERQVLRQAYLAAFRRNFKSVLDNIEVVDGPVVKN